MSEKMDKNGVYEPSKNKKYLKRQGFILSLIVLTVLGYDFFNYVTLPPLLRVANLETLKHPYSDSIKIDSAFKNYIQLGSDQNRVIDIFENSDFNLRIVDSKELGLADRQRTKEGNQFYSGRKKMSAGLIKKIFLFGEYDVRVLLEFKETKLVDVRATILLETL